MYTVVVSGNGARHHRQGADMPDTSPHIRIRPDDLEVLRALSEEEDRPMVAIITAALKAYVKARRHSRPSTGV